MSRPFACLAGLLLAPLVTEPWGQGDAIQIGSTVTEAHHALQTARAPRQAARAANNVQALVEEYLRAHARAAPALPSLLRR